jgi:hypothetical protein
VLRSSARVPEVFLEASSELARIVAQFAELLWGGNVLEGLSVNGHWARLIPCSRLGGWLVGNVAKDCADDVAVLIANECEFHR